MTDIDYTKKYQSSGVISGFNEIDLDSDGTQEVIAQESYSLAEFIARLRELRDLFNPNVLYEFERLIQQHMQNEENPHQVTLEQIGADIVEILYQHWISVGNTGTIDTFRSILFQDNQIAQIQEVLDGVGNGLVTVAGHKARIAAHTADTNAHAGLIDKFLPGTPPTTMPSYAFMAILGSPLGCTVVRNSTLSIITATGYLDTVAANTLAIDYSTGAPMYSLWGSRTNLLSHSDPEQNTNQLGTERSNSAVIDLKRGTSAKLYTEDTSLQEHGCEFSVDLTDPLEYVISFFVHPSVTTGFLRIYDTDDHNQSIWYNIADRTIESMSDDVIGICHALPNEWSRIGYQFLLDSARTVNLRISWAPSITDDVYTYIGKAKDIYSLYGLQVTPGAGLSPYIETSGASASHDATVVTIATSQDINPLQGMIVANVLTPTSVLNSTRTLASVADSISISMQQATCKVTTEHTDELYQSISSAMITGEATVVAFTYGSTLAIKTADYDRVSVTNTLGSLHEDTLSIVLNSIDEPFDGYLESMVVYPVSDQDRSLEFFTGV